MNEPTDGKDKSSKTPEQDALLLAAELELTQARLRRTPAPASRTAFRIWALVFIAALVAIALLALQWIVSTIPRPAHNDSPAQAQQTPEPH
ncbi:MAG: hypothetical protein M3O82_06705 [Verrucomicrobiota bacterium]|nr:hypothetical protein [Verrucomicrobiota bacterium]